MKLVLLRALALVGVVGLFTGGYAVVGFLETHFALRAERDVLASRVDGLLAQGALREQAGFRTQARLIEACRMLPFQTFDSCLTTIDVRLDRRARRLGR